MHYSFNRVLSVLLAGLMLMSLVACSSPDDVTDDTKTAETEIRGETGDPNFTCDLPGSLSFNNTEVTTMYVNVDGRADELYSPKLGYGTVSDAVYERNVAVENALDVKLAFVDVANDGEANSKLGNMVSAGDRSVEIFTFASYMAIPGAVSGVFLDLNQVDHVDLSKHYWSQDYNPVATFTSKNMQFLATSTAALSMFRLAYLTIFNVDLMKDRSMPSLYDAVDNGEWTLDYQYSLVNDIWVDTDGSGANSEGDFYGHITGDTITMDTYPVACNVHLVIRDENGDWYFNSKELDNMVSMAEKVSALVNAPGTYKFKGAGSDFVGDNAIIKKFSQEGGLMATVQFLSIEMCIESLADLTYGIVPMPKLNQHQPDYYTYVQDQVTGFGISSAIGYDNDHQEMLGAVMEAMAYYSYEIVRPAYYESTLSLRFMQDERSYDMLGLMFRTISYDYAYLHPGGLGGIKADMRTVLPSRNPAVSSYMRRWEKAIEKQLNTEKLALDKLLE